ncbi:MAG: LapA family protein [Acetobacteraceae bacterium]
MKLRALSRWIVGVPLLLLMVVFALSNSKPVTLGLFPLGRLPFEVPLSVVVLAAMGLGFFLGGLRLWFTALHHRRAARRAEEAMRLLEARLQELKAKTSGPALTHAGATSRA